MIIIFLCFLDPVIPGQTFPVSDVFGGHLEVILGPFCCFRANLALSQPILTNYDHFMSFLGHFCVFEVNFCVFGVNF